MLGEIAEIAAGPRPSTSCSSPATSTSRRRRPPRPRRWSTQRCSTCAHRGARRGDRRQPRQRGAVRGGPPAAAARRGHHGARPRRPARRRRRGRRSTTAGGERARVALLPFCSQRYSVRAAELMAARRRGGGRRVRRPARGDRRRAVRGLRADAVNLLVAHCMVRGGHRRRRTRRADRVRALLALGRRVPAVARVRRARPPPPRAADAGRRAGLVLGLADPGRLRRGGSRQARARGRRHPRPRRRQVGTVPLAHGHRAAHA